MVTDDQKPFDSLIQHLKNAFQSGETISKLISDFYGQTQKKNESKDAFADDLQVLVQKIMVQKTEFRLAANEQLKIQYADKLWDLYYVAIAHSSLQTLDSKESFMQFQGHLAMTFSGQSRLGKTGSHTSLVEVSSCIISEETGKHKLSKNSQQRQNQINK